MSASDLLGRLKRLKRVFAAVGVAYVVVVVIITVVVLATTHKGSYPSWYGWTLAAGFIVGLCVALVALGVSYMKRARLYGDVQPRRSIFDGPESDWNRKIDEAREAAARQTKVTDGSGWVHPGELELPAEPRRDGGGGAP